MSSSDEESKALAHPEFWDERYSKSDGQAPTHEWFRSYADLRPFFEKHLFETYGASRNPKILHLGAGDSTIPEELLHHGYHNQICLDFSPVLVQRMESRKKLNGVSWLCADVRNMPVIENKSIDVAFDKGTLDAMIYGSPWDPLDEVKENSARYMREVSRTLKDDGVFLYVTYRQPHFVKPLLNQDDLWSLEMEVLGGETSFEYYAFAMKKEQMSQT